MVELKSGPPWMGKLKSSRALIALVLTFISTVQGLLFSNCLGFVELHLFLCSLVVQAQRGKKLHLRILYLFFFLGFLDFTN